VRRRVRRRRGREGGPGRGPREGRGDGVGGVVVSVAVFSRCALAFSAFLCPSFGVNMMIYEPSAVVIHMIVKMHK